MFCWSDGWEAPGGTGGRAFALGLAPLLRAFLGAVELLVAGCWWDVTDRMDSVGDVARSFLLAEVMISDEHR